MLKIILIFGLTLLCTLATFSQVPNGGFENWTNGEPDNWGTTNDPPALITISQSTTAHSGSYAAQGQPRPVYTIIVAPQLLSGNNGDGFHYVGRPVAVSGYYQLKPINGEYIQVTAALTRQDTGLAYATGIINTAASSYTSFSVPLVYIGPGDADSAWVYFSLTKSGGSPDTNATFLLDDIALSGTNGVDRTPGVSPNSFALDQNYPNPFNPSTTIGYSVPSRSHAQLTVFNTLGQRVAELVNDEVGPGHYTVQFNASGLASGMYFYRLQAEHFVQTRSFMLVK